MLGVIQSNQQKSWPNYAESGKYQDHITRWAKSWWPTGRSMLPIK